MTDLDNILIFVNGAQGIRPVASVIESSETDFPCDYSLAIFSEADCAFTHLSDPTTFTATFE
jgi:hypothetical protein